MLRYILIIIALVVRLVWGLADKELLSKVTVLVVQAGMGLADKELLSKV